MKFSSRSFFSFIHFFFFLFDIHFLKIQGNKTTVCVLVGTYCYQIILHQAEIQLSTTSCVAFEIKRKKEYKLLIYKKKCKLQTKKFSEQIVKLF